MVIYIGQYLNNFSLRGKKPLDTTHTEHHTIAFVTSPIPDSEIDIEGINPLFHFRVLNQVHVHFLFVT